MKSKIKNQKSKMKYFLAGMMALLAVSCVAPEEWHVQYDKSIVPGPVTDVEVENVNGGAIISYTFPSDVDKKDMLGAKVVYSLTTDGELMERWTSAEKDTIVLEGYGDTETRFVTVYTVHKNGNVSEGVAALIKPLTPPIFLIRETMKAAATFGGVQITWDNPLRKDMGVGLYAEDSITHEMVLFDKYFSNGIDGKITFRHFEPEEQNFRIEMFDRWQNYAQPLETTLTPLEEVDIESMDERNIPIWTLFDDGRVSAAVSALRFLYRCDIHDDPYDPAFAHYSFANACDWENRGTASIWFPGINATREWYVPGAGNGMLPYPLYVTMDMGREAVYSRVWYLPFARTPNFSGDLPVEFDIWGTNNPKTIEEVECPYGIYPKGSREANQAYWSSWEFTNGTDAWKNDGWVKFASCKYLLSDGTNRWYDGLVLSPEDLAQYTSLGYYFDFDLGVTESFRYLRWEIHSVSSDARRLRLHSLRFWGSYVD